MIFLIKRELDKRHREHLVNEAKQNIKKIIEPILENKPVVIEVRQEPLNAEFALLCKRQKHFIKNMKKQAKTASNKAFL